MDYLRLLFIEHSALQAIIVLSLISAIGLMAGKVRILGISLGITFVFFTGILAGHFGLSIDSQMLFYAETFGLVLFVYALGLQVGPGFFSSMRTEGVKLLLPAIAVLIIGTLTAVGLGFATNVSMPDMSGILCGATTNTPALAAAQQTLEQLGINGNGAALSCAITYPLGVVGVILAIIFLRKFFVRSSDMPQPDSKHNKNVFIASYCVTNPAIFGRTIAEVVHSLHNYCVISRMWHDGHVLIPMSDRILQENDVLLVITKPEEAEELRLVFGKQEQKDWNSENIDWNKIDSELTSQRILVTRPEINGKKLSDLRLRTKYNINITRINRAGIDLVPYQGMELQIGDRVMVVGQEKAIEQVADVLGNSMKKLNEPQLLTIFFGIALGVLFGSVPLMNIPQPVKLGLAGGPLIIALLIGRFGPHFHLVTYTTMSANLMLREVGLAMFLAGVGIGAGDGFIEAIVGGGYRWIGYGVIITVLPLLIVGLFARLKLKMNYYTLMGLMAGSVTDPPALGYANATAGNDMPAVGYATVYPVVMFLRVLTAQLLILMAA